MEKYTEKYNPDIQSNANVSIILKSMRLNKSTSPKATGIDTMIYDHTIFKFEFVLVLKKTPIMNTV